MHRLKDSKYRQQRAGFYRQNGDIVVCAAEPDANRRFSQDHMHRRIAADQDLEVQLLALWPEVRDANLVA